MDINKMTRSQFDALPYRTDWATDIECDALIILPKRTKHDSGYRCMDFVAVDKDSPICRLSGCSDVIHIEGIGGFGKDWSRKYNTVPSLVPVAGWTIDCLPKSGLLRMWCDGRIICGASLSSFEIYYKPKEKTNG